MAKGGVGKWPCSTPRDNRGESFSEFLGAVRPAINCSVCVSSPREQSHPAHRGELSRTEGYRRIKLKIEPGTRCRTGRRRARGRRHPVPGGRQRGLHARRHRHPALAALDAFDLLLIEQPLPEDDIVGHAERDTRRPSASTNRSRRRAVQGVRWRTAPCRIVNIKAGRVGGYLEAKRVHDVCAAANVPCEVRRKKRDQHSAGPRTSRSPRSQTSGTPATRHSPTVLHGGRLRAVRPRRRASLAVPAGPGSVSRRLRTSSNGSRRSSRCVDREQAKLQLEHDSLIDTVFSRSELGTTRPGGSASGNGTYSGGPRCARPPRGTSPKQSR